jgi:HK97 family phage major capsid protein
MAISRALRDYLVTQGWIESDAPEREFRKVAGKALRDGRLPGDTFVELSSQKGSSDMDRITPYQAFGSTSSTTNKRYSNKRVDAVHAKTKQTIQHPAHYEGQTVQLPSQLEKAKTGAWLRMLALRSGLAGSIPGLNDRERELLQDTIRSDYFVDPMADEPGKVFKLDHVKSDDLLSDTTSGGAYFNPLWYDLNIVTFPLLYGEFYPFVDTVDMPRSNLVNTASIANPTVTWGETEGTGLTPFDATSLVKQITASVVNVMIGVRVGLDLLSDAEPLNIGDYLVQTIGMRMMAELDRVIVDGNGSTEPLGILNTSSLNTATTDFGSNGPATVGDHEALMFGVAKQYRQKPWEPCFFGNDTSYMRARGIPVAAGDERRVFGMTEGDYTLLGYPFRINNIGIPNATKGFGCLKRYRLWRRLGFFTRWTMEGSTLALANEALLVVRGRFAGKPIDTNAFCITTTGQN